MTNTFVQVESKNYRHSWNDNVMVDDTKFIWEGEHTVAKLCKYVNTYQPRTERGFPMFWKTKVVQRPAVTKYYLLVRTKEESEYHDGHIHEKYENDDAAFKAAFEWLDMNRFR